MEIKAVTYIIFTFLDDLHPGGEGLVGGFDLQHPGFEVQVVVLDKVDVVYSDHLQQTQHIKTIKVIRNLYA